MKILFIGPQGSGKSTQAKLLGEYLKIPVISTGDILREIAPLNEWIRKILDEGRLVDDQTMSKQVKERLKQEDCQRGFILDGYPRTVEQINLFDPKFDLVFFLNLPDKEALVRLLARGRKDDTEHLINQRLKFYHQNTDPIVDYFRKKGLLIEINGRDAIDNIQLKIRKAVDEQNPK